MHIARERDQVEGDATGFPDVWERPSAQVEDLDEFRVLWGEAVKLVGDEG